MPIDRVVVNASPIIVLFKSGLDHLVESLFEEVVVPDAVWEEVTSTGKSDEAAVSLADAAWVRRSAVSISEAVLAWDLGRGESQVLSYASQNPQYRAVVDDAQARKCAQSLGIQTLGTGDLPVMAKRKGLIPSVGEALEEIMSSGLWLSAQIIHILKKQAGE